MKGVKNNMKNCLKSSYSWNFGGGNRLKELNHKGFQNNKNDLHVSTLRFEDKSPLRYMKSAFTLAEVLITLGIIGVVAAMTIPTLISKINDLRNVAILKEDYSILQQVMKSAYNEGATGFDVGESNSEVNMKNWFNKYLAPYMRVEKLCIGEKGCWSEQNHKTLAGMNWVRDNKDGPGFGPGRLPLCFVLSNGSQVCIDDYPDPWLYKDFGISYPLSDGEAGMVFFVDVNGSKQPNVLGKDTFVLVAMADQFVPAGNNLSQDEIRKDCSKQGTGEFCAWVVKNSGWQIPKIK